MRKYSLWDAIISIIAIAAVCAAMVPAVARLQRTPEDATCQANMRRWADAIHLYMADWNGCYPTNRLKPNMMLTSQATLSIQDGFADPNAPNRFQYSINWVEALYPYMISDAQKTGRNWKSFLKCPNASNTVYPINSKTPRVSYAFNYNLLEKPDFVVRDASKLMMMREMDRLVDSCCRPTNNTTGTSSTSPNSPFLVDHDSIIRTSPINNRLHGQGSYIVYADGHVQYFSVDYFPISTYLVSNDSWDYQTQQWWNWVGRGHGMDKAIAVTP